MNYSEALVLLAPLRLLPLEMSPLERRNLIRTPLEGIPLQLDHLLGFVLYLVYVSGLALLDHEVAILHEHVSWGVSGIPVPSGFQRFWLQPLISKFRDILLIIIYTLEGLKSDQF